MTKPGIIYGNLFTATAGFLLAAQGTVNWPRLLALLTGTGLIIACGCVLNNYMDRELDIKMTRTQKRASVTGTISVRDGMIFAILLGVIGIGVLLVWVNLLTALIGLFGLMMYVLVYGYAKRHSVHGTLVGTIPGATPPVAGYTAVTNQIDGVAVVLFLILVCWQMIHFYAIAIYRLKEYKAAGLPVLPAVKGFTVTRWQMLVYLLAFVVVSGWLTIAGYASGVILIVSLALGIGWLYYWARPTTNHVAWGKQMFLFSLLVLVVLSVAISIDSFFAQ